MAEWINFADIRARVSLEDVLFRYYKLEGLKREGHKIVGCCPVHGGDSPRAFHADLDKNVWHCFSRCKKGGNQLDFVVAKDGVSVRDAALKLQAFFLGSGSASAPRRGEAAAPSAPPAIPTPSPMTSGGASATESESEGNPPLDVCLELKGDHPHLTLERKLRPETIERFGVGYASRGIMRGTIAIPIHDEEGELVAYAGRRLKPADIRELGKYKFPKGFKKDLVLFNYQRAREHEAEEGLIVVQSFFTVMKLAEAGFDNVVSSMGSELSAHQAKLLLDAKDVVLLFDPDEAGMLGADKARELLTRMGVTVRLVRLPRGTKPDEIDSELLWWAMNGLRSFNLVELALATRSPVEASG